MHTSCHTLAFPCAKINIGLYVTGRRADGYHDLQTVFYPVPLQDVLEIKPLRGSTAPYSLQVAGTPVGGAAEDNLVVKVYRDAAAEFSLPPLDIYLNKRIPMGAGLGGGSSDAAAMLLLLNEEFDLGLTREQMKTRIACYGADCAFFIDSQPAYATGIGDQLSPLPLSLKGLTLLLVKPKEGVSTREAYAGITPQTPPHDLRKTLLRPVEEWKGRVANDFEPHIFALHPKIAAIKQTLYDMGALYAAMSGSGSTVFGLFAHEQESAAAVFADCFVLQQRLRV